MNFPLFQAIHGESLLASFGADLTHSIRTFLMAFSIVIDTFFVHDNFDLFCSVVKEEISDEEMNLPCFNGRVVAWVSGFAISL